MTKAQQAKFYLLYQKHVNALKRQGKFKATIDAYFRAVRRIVSYLDRNELQFFYKYVLEKTMGMGRYR